MAKSTTSRSGRKARRANAEKPYLTMAFHWLHHLCGQYCKQHRGRQFYFGMLNDWKAALANYEREWPYIKEGRTPPLPRRHG